MSDNPNATTFLTVHREDLKREIQDLETRKTVHAWLEGQFRSLAEVLPDCIFFKDRDSKFLWVNQATIKLLGCKDISSIIGKSDYDFFVKEHADAARADEVHVLETGESIFNRLEQDNYADGSQRWAYVTRMPLRNAAGEIVGTYGTTKDVTENMKTQEAYEMESRLLKALLENIPDAVYFKDNQSRFVRVSRGIHLEGIKNLEDAVGKTDFDYFTKEHAQQAFDDEQAIIRTGVGIVNKIERETFENRDDAWVSTTKVPIYDRMNKISGIVGISRDVTQNFKAEELVRKARDELEIRVQERTSALVQEIKEHLRTEKAMREGERKLQESNLNLEARVEQLNFLNATAHRLARFTHRRDLLPAIADAFARSREGLQAALLEKEDEVWRLRAHTPGLRESGSLEFCERLAAVLNLGDQAAPLLVPDLHHDSRFSNLGLLGKGVPPAFLMIPLQVENRTSALVQVFGDLEFAMWYAQEEVVINTLAAQAAVCLSNANNFQSLEARARVEGELTVAHNIQKRFTPKENPDIPRVILKGFYLPAYEVGGDYLDYFRTEKGSWVLVVADVSGKGIPAALVMTMLRSTFRAEARYETTAKGLLCAVNSLIMQDLDEKTFVTAACLVIDSDSAWMTYARAGHPPLILQHGHDGGSVESVNPRGLALGLASGEIFADALQEVSLPLQPGDRFLLYTDGLVEGMDPERNVYGMPRLLNLLKREKGKAPDSLVLSILDDLRSFTQNQPNRDDLTMLAIEVKER